MNWAWKAAFGANDQQWACCVFITSVCIWVGNYPDQKPTAKELFGPGCPDYPVCDICWHVIMPSDKECKTCTVEDTCFDPPIPKYSKERRKW